MPDTALLIIDLRPALLTGAHDLDAGLSRVAGLADRARSAGAPVGYLRQRLDEPSDVHSRWHPGRATSSWTRTARTGSSGRACDRGDTGR